MSEQELHLDNEPSERQLDSAIAYNKRFAPEKFLCQSTWTVIRPASTDGVRWIWRQQELLDLAVDGKLGGETSAALTYRYGPFAMNPHTIVRMPIWRHLWGYDHAADDFLHEWPIRQPRFDDFLDQQEGFVQGVLRLVTGWNSHSRKFNRWPRSVISLDTISVGCFHYWAETLAEHLPDVMETTGLPPEDIFDTCPDDLPSIVMDEVPLEELLKPRTGKMKMHFRLADLVVGWRSLLQGHAALRAHCNVWLENYVGDALSIIRSYGWSRHLKSDDGARILALVTRMRNSGSVKRRIRAGVREVGSRRDPMKVLKATYNLDRDKGGYGKPHRFKKVMRWDQFDGPAPSDYLL